MASDEDRTDVYSEEKRSIVMSKVKSKNSKPEIELRSILHCLGFRFSLHSDKLPGKPDILLSKYKTVVFVHGCFWHQHEGCGKATIPRQNHEFWKKKLYRNKERDREVQEKLLKLGWNVATVWECELRKGEDAVIQELTEFIREPKTESMLMNDFSSELAAEKR